MRKYLFYLVALGASISLFPSCSDDDANTPSEEQQQKQAEETIETSGSGEFESTNDPSQPAVTGHVANLTTNGAEIHGYANITAANVSTFDEMGIVYSAIDCTPDREKPGISTLGKLYGYRITKSLTNSEFSLSLNNLWGPSTTVFYRAYVKVGNVYYYGEIKQFTTKAAVVLTNDVIIVNYFNVKINGATLTYNGDAADVKKQWRFG